MNNKSIGSFISALRKANGLTQKDLAEKLSVSDKTVSRWERDKGVPDLSLIPVIAEIFGITTDELLRGERKPDLELPAQGSNTRTDRQRKRILTASLSQYRNKSFIAAGLICCGFIAALIGNFAFLRAYLGFFLGMVFFLSGVIAQLIFINTAFLSVNHEEYDKEDVGTYTRSLVLIGQKVIGFAFVLFVATLPLLLFIRDAHMGLGGDSFLSSGLIFGFIALVLWAVAIYFINRNLIKKGKLFLPEKIAFAYHRNYGLKRICVLILGGALLLTFVVHYNATGGWYAGNVAKTTAFDDFDSFRTFMEQEVPNPDDFHKEALLQSSAEGYFDADGNPISEEEARTRTITDPEGNVIGNYIARNQSVWSVRTTFSGGELQFPITVSTRDQILAAQQKIDHLNSLFIIIYIIEAVATVLIYFSKRIKY